MKQIALGSFVVLLTAVACSAQPSSSFTTESNATKPAKGSTGFATGGDAGAAPSAGCQSDPSFYDVPGDNCDNDGDGKVDNPKTCDAAITGNAATDFAHAIGICNDAAKDGYGLVAATFSRGFSDQTTPDDGQHGILGKFGDVLKPREGAMLGVLSTGFAQEFDGSPNTPFTDSKTWWDDTSTTALPTGFPKAAGTCTQSNEVSDLIVLNLTLKAPKNAGGLKFDFDFHSSEWPQWICTQFNDGFLAFLTSKTKTDNISFDSQSNPVSINNAFFDRCTPNATVGCNGDTTSVAKCPGGASELSGTGFGITAEGCDDGQQATQGGATGWLSSSSPIGAEEQFTLQLAIWDTGDGSLDSSVLLDNFQWVGGTVTATTTERPIDVK